MASPQKENGYTAIANEIMDAIMKYRIPGESRQVLDCILRLTYGWNRKEVQISNNKISEMTGLKRQNVIRGIRWLESKLILLRIKSDSNSTKVLKFNKNFDDWTPFTKKHLRIKSDSKDRIKSDSKDRIKSDSNNQVVPIIVKTNKNNNKTISANFLSFWEKYPLKKSKKKAEEVWITLSKKNKLPAIDKILESIEIQIKEKELLIKNEKFCPDWKHPTTWLNQGCWDDECKLDYKTEYEKWLEKT